MALRFVALLTLAVGAVACAHGRDQHKPDAEVASPQQAVVDERARMMRPADPPSAIPPPTLINPVQPMPPPAEANAQAGTPAPAGTDDELANVGPNQAQLEAEAEANAEAAAKDKAKWAKQARDADRRETEEWSRDRVQKAAARAAELQNQTSRIPQNRRGRFNTDMTMFQTRKAQVISKINSLPATGSDEWKITKAELDHAIDEMDHALNRLENYF